MYGMDRPVPPCRLYSTEGRVLLPIGPFCLFAFYCGQSHPLLCFTLGKQRIGEFQAGFSSQVVSFGARKPTPCAIPNGLA